MKNKNLPPDVKETDTKWPSYNAKPWRTGDNADLPMSITFYKVGGEKARQDRGWIVATLHISNGKKGQPNRTYGIGVDDGKVYTVGNGPHVTDEVTVYLSGDNIDRLRKYVDLYLKGMADASSIRDRISSRRAQGQLHRAAGRSSWMW